MAKDYLELAIEERARRQAAAEEAELMNLANTLREADERQARHTALRAKHGLPDHAEPRQIADCEIAYAKAWGSHVASRFGGGARAGHVLDPHTSGYTDPAMIAELIALRDRLRHEFESSWPPADLAARTAPGTTDGVAYLFGHGRAA